LRTTGYFSRVTGHGSRFRLYAAILILLTLLVPLFWYLLIPRDDGTLDAIQRRGTLRVGLDASFPPFETIDDSGQIVGLDVDMARAIAADIGVEAEFVNIGFDGLYDALLARRVDIVISGLPYDPRWTQDVAYTRNYFNAGQVLVTRTNDEMITTVEDLHGRRVAVEWGSQADMEGRRLERDLSGLTILRQATAAEALETLLNDQADAAIVDAVSGVNAVPQGLRIAIYLTDEWYAAAVHIDSQALLEAVNQSLERLDESGQMAEMQAKWLHGQY
jgi:polar amino acid transport system substrate-binding protein